jgi:hypothetical protein
MIFAGNTKKRIGGIVMLVLSGVLLFGSACNKSEPASNASMTATINGNQVTFTVSLSSSNGYTIVSGSSSNYSMQLVFKTLSAGIFTLGDQSTGYYATVTDNFGYSYSTTAANTGQITLTQQAGSRYNGTFYFTAVETSPTSGGATISATNGNCTNI